MQRREALKKTALMIAGVAITPGLFAASVSKVAANEAERLLPADKLDLLAEMANVIIPDTDTPGAKAAGVHKIIAVLLEDCYPADRRSHFYKEMEAVESLCMAQFGQSFLKCADGQRIQLFQKLELNAKTTREQMPDAVPFFQMLKELTIFTYFNSEIGATKALAYDPIPGGWIPDMPLEPDQKAWTPMF